MPRVPREHARYTPSVLLALAVALLLPVSLEAQATASRPSSSAEVAVRAVVDSALAAINSGDLIALSNLMTDSAQVYGAREEGGVKTFSFRTAASQRAAGRRAPIIERTFGGDVRVAGSMASVWLPYDLWAEGKWSNCGVDQFTLVQVGDAWRIVNFTYSVEQPPACRMHPDGPPPGYRPPGSLR